VGGWIACVMVVVVFDQRDPKKLRTNLAPLTKFGPIHDYQLRLSLRQHVRVGFRCAQPHPGAAKTRFPNSFFF
jgi:hypothetical protein